jgi:hypothetical protein
VKERGRIDNRRFKVFGESAHRLLARWLCGQIDSEKDNITKPSQTSALLKVDRHRGILMLYPVRETARSRVCLGYELLFPENDLGFETNFTVKVKEAEDRIVVSPKR